MNTLPTGPLNYKKIRSKKKKQVEKSEIDFSKLDLNEDFKMTLDLVENTNRNLFVTGKAGTGKSTLLKLIKARSNKNLIVLAPTGLAALNVGGQTIHSFFKLPFNLLTDEKIIKVRDSRLMKSLELLIIDEISMVRADVMDAIDRSLRINREINKPFGGVQLLLFGDMFQLPPVVKGNELAMYFDDNLGGPYFFNAKVFDEFALELVELKKIYRQVDEDFISTLNRIREKRIDETLINKLNSTLSKEGRTLEDNYIILSTTNSSVNLINEYELRQIRMPVYTYSAYVTGKFSEESFPTELDLNLKVGAQVILTKNDQRRRWVNGTIARVSNLGKGFINVEIKGKEYTLNLETWENVEYIYDQKTEKVKEKIVGSFTQFPIKLAWALTIHKSQGQTFEKVIIDVGTGAFTHGQTYVALSRCKTAEGIVLSRPIKISDIIIDDRVYDVYSKFEVIN